MKKTTIIGKSIEIIEFSLIKEENMPANFEHSIKNDIDIFKGAYNNFDIEFHFKDNVLFKKFISPSYKSIHDETSYECIAAEFLTSQKEPLLLSLSLDFITYQLNSIYSYEAFSQKRIMSRNQHQFQPDLFNDRIFDALKSIGNYDILKIYSNSQWLQTFIRFLNLFNQNNIRNDLTDFLMLDIVDFEKPTNELFDMIDINFLSY